MAFGDGRHACGYHACAKNKKPQRSEKRWDELKNRLFQGSGVDGPLLLDGDCSGCHVGLPPVGNRTFVKESIVFSGVFISLGNIRLAAAAPAAVPSSFRDLGLLLGGKGVAIRVESGVALVVGMARVLASGADWSGICSGSGGFAAQALAPPLIFALASSSSDRGVFMT